MDPRQVQSDQKRKMKLRYPGRTTIESFWMTPWHYHAWSFLKMENSMQMTICKAKVQDGAGVCDRGGAGGLHLRWKAASRQPSAMMRVRMTRTRTMGIQNRRVQMSAANSLADSAGFLRSPGPVLGGGGMSACVHTHHLMYHLCKMPCSYFSHGSLEGSRGRDAWAAEGWSAPRFESTINVSARRTLKYHGISRCGGEMAGRYRQLRDQCLSMLFICSRHFGRPGYAHVTPLTLGLRWRRLICRHMCAPAACIAITLCEGMSCTHAASICSSETVLQGSNEASGSR